MEKVAENSYNICIEIGSSRVKIGLQDISNSDFKFLYKDTSYFFYPIENLIEKLSQLFEENGVKQVEKLAISTTGEVDINTGTIQSCGTLRAISKQKHFRNFKLVEILNSNLKQPIMNKEFTYLINDGHSAGLGMYYYQKDKQAFPYVVLSLGTYPAVAILTNDEITTVDSRKNFINGKHISQLAAKCLVVKDGLSDVEYTNNLLVLTTLLQAICFQLVNQEMTHLYIVGGMSNHILDEEFYKEDKIKNHVTIIRDDKILYSQIIFPGLLKFNPKESKLNLQYHEKFNLSINV